MPSKRHPHDHYAFDLVMHRVLDAPPDLVYDCWTTPEHLARWGGAPEGLTVEVEYQDIREGGTFRIRMRSPYGIDSRLEGTYRELIRPRKIVFTHAWVHEDGSLAPETVVTIVLEAAGEKTRLTLTQTGLDSLPARDGHAAGWTSTFERLSGFLNETRSKA